MKTLPTLISALVTLIEGWQNPTNIEADIADAVLALGTVKAVDPGAPFIGAAQKLVNSTQAGLANLQSGQAATVASKDGYSLVLVKQGGAAAQALGL